MQLLVAHVVKRGTRKPNILCLSLGLTTESGVIALIQFVCAKFVIHFNVNLAVIQYEVRANLQIFLYKIEELK